LEGVARLAADETLPELARELFASLAEEEAQLGGQLRAHALPSFLP
jgi:hypothetical protein